MDGHDGTISNGSSYDPKMRTFYEMILGKKDARIYVQRLPNNRKVFGLLNPSESSSLLHLKRFTLRTEGLNDGTDAEP